MGKSQLDLSEIDVDIDSKEPFGLTNIINDNANAVKKEQKEQEDQKAIIQVEEYNPSDSDKEDLYSAHKGEGNEYDKYDKYNEHRSEHESDEYNESEHNYEQGDYADDYADNYADDYYDEPDRQVEESSRQSAQEEANLNVLHAQQLVNKRTLVIKIKELQQRLYDVELNPKTFTTSDSLEELQYEFERLTTLKNMRSTRNWYRKILLAVTNGLEWMNHKWNPVGLQLDGWSTDLASNLDEFDDIFDELSEKYGGSVVEKVPPELRLILLVLYSGMAYSISQTLAKQQTPDLAEIINKDPELRSRFVKAATDIQMERTQPHVSALFESVKDIFAGSGKTNATGDAQGGMTSVNRATNVSNFMSSLDKSDLQVNELGL